MRATPADRIHPGLNLTKIRKGKDRYPIQRLAQVSAVTPTHAILYWPDSDQQTSVRLERLNRTTEWRTQR